MRISRLVLGAAVVGVVSLAVVACSTPAASGPQANAVAEFVKNASPDVKAAYEYAVTNPKELAKYPCYCGCNAMGHASNLSCFVKRFEVNGQPVFDSHALGCGICVDIAKDVMRLKGEGKSSREVRAYIDGRYSAFGPSTITPLPVD